jgi:hypothetical protein
MNNRSILTPFVVATLFVGLVSSCSKDNDREQTPVVSLGGSENSGGKDELGGDEGIGVGGRGGNSKGGNSKGGNSANGGTSSQSDTTPLVGGASSQGGTSSVLTSQGSGTSTDIGGAGSIGGSTNKTTLGPDGCYIYPKTHLEIINACTDAMKIDKATHLNSAGFNTSGELLAPSALPPL